MATKKAAAKKPGTKKAAGAKKLLLKGLIRMSPKDRAAAVSANIGETTPLRVFLREQGWR
jgi:hypothetical protein